MKLIFNIRMYHGTKCDNVKSIINNGFDTNTISCATQDIHWAEKYGDTLITFKYPYEISFSLKDIMSDGIKIFWFLRDMINNNIAIRLNGFKPTKVSIVNSYKQH